ncbi:MAG: hypothetical protein WA549_05835 [Thermoplasmata archaeon]
MNRWRTLRQRRGRARRGQVSAVATVFGLLIVVTFISNFLLLQLPGEEANNEYNHLLQVENQLASLEAVLSAQVKQPGFGYTLTAPVTLGSQGVPPFGPPATSSIYLQQDGLMANLTLPGIQSNFVSGVNVQLNNLYTPTAHIVLEQGAVILSQTDGTPVMVEPPQFAFSGSASSARTANLTLFSFEGPPIGQSGVMTAVVLTQVLSASTYTIAVPNTATTSGASLNLTTDYPVAWVTYFAPLGTYIHSLSCFQYGIPVSCGTPPSGPVQISVLLNVNFVTVTAATVSVTFD